MKQFAILILSILIFSACNQVKDLNRNDIIGTWQNTFLKVEMKSYNNSKRDTILEIEEKDWLNVLQIKPVKTSYFKDGTYQSKYYNENDLEIYKSSGKWTVSKDSLILEQLKPMKNLSAYKTEIKDNIASFKAILDWDMDKKDDDIYFGMQKKLK